MRQVRIAKHAVFIVWSETICGKCTFFALLSRILKVRHPLTLAWKRTPCYILYTLTTIFGCAGNRIRFWWLDLSLSVLEDQPIVTNIRILLVDQIVFDWCFDNLINRVFSYNCRVIGPRRIHDHRLVLMCVYRINTLKFEHAPTILLLFLNKLVWDLLISVHEDTPLFIANVYGVGASICGLLHKRFCVS